jgi:short subunit dehydrogenase-like uncharacterized protein
MGLMRATSADPEARRLMNDPYTLTPDRGAEPELGGQPDLRWRRGGDITPELKGYWVGPFVMAAANTRIVRRSNALLEYAYDRRFEYAEQMSGSFLCITCCGRGKRRSQRRDHGAWQSLLQPVTREARRSHRPEARHRAE